MSITNQIPFKRQKGLSLIEVLIAIVIIAIGLLGIAGLQVTGLQNNVSANLRSNATMLAYEYSDILRSNMAEVNNNYFGTSADDGAEYTTSTPGSVVAACEQVANSCSTSQMAQTQLARWAQRVASQLPSGVATSDRIGDVYNVAITWRDDRANDANVTFTTSFEP